MAVIRYIPEEPTYGSGLKAVTDTNGFVEVSVSVDDETICVSDGELSVLAGYTKTEVSAPYYLTEIGYVSFAPTDDGPNVYAYTGGYMQMPYTYTVNGNAYSSSYGISLSYPFSKSESASDEIRINSDMSIVLVRNTAAVAFKGAPYDVRTFAGNLNDYRIHMGDDTLTYDDLAEYYISVAQEQSGDATITTENAATTWFSSNPYVEAWDLDSSYEVSLGTFPNNTTYPMTFSTASIYGYESATAEPTAVILTATTGFPVATSTKGGVVKYDDSTIKVNSSGQLYVASVGTSYDDTELRELIASLQDAVSALEDRVEALESGESTMDSSVDGDYLVLTGSSVTVTDDVLSITSEDARITNDYLALGSVTDAFVGADELNLTGSSASVEDDYLNITSTDATVTDDVLDL